MVCQDHVDIVDSGDGLKRWKERAFWRAPKMRKPLVSSEGVASLMKYEKVTKIMICQPDVLQFLACPKTGVYGSIAYLIIDVIPFQEV